MLCFFNLGYDHLDFQANKHVGAPANGYSGANSDVTTL